MLTAYLRGVGIYGAGLTDWAKAVAVLTEPAVEDEPEAAGALPEPDVQILPPNERRRSSATVLWALHVASQAVAHAQCDPRDLATVFATSGGEYDVLNNICSGLAAPERSISPTKFHHSVHNAAAGYWCIATGNHKRSTSIAAYDFTFAMGLLEACTIVEAETETVLLVAYDLPPPTPLFPARPLTAPFAVALVIGPDGTRSSLAKLELECGHPTPHSSRMSPSHLESLRRGNPAAHALPLLAALATKSTDSIIFGCSRDASLRVRLSPCAY